MSDKTTIWLSDAEKASFCGESLKYTLYTKPLTILLAGELGAGKTTFLQGFAKAFGIESPLTSPTYALEQRYETPNGKFIHCDLYRLSPSQAQELVESTNDHSGIRCIEWAERLEKPLSEPHIYIELKDDHKKPGRNLSVTFNDIPLPSREEILKWRKELLLPGHIGKHCDTVASFIQDSIEILLKRGILLRPMALVRAAEVHDLLRFVDFPSDFQKLFTPTKEQLSVWKNWKTQYDGLKHEEACATFLRARGFDALASIVEVHGLRLPSPNRATIEQKLLFYADKRVKFDEVVSLDERFDDFCERYGKGKQSKESTIWYKEAKELEKELFPE